MVSINLRGRCKSVELISRNANPGLCMVRVELDYDVSLTRHLHEIQLFVPTKFGTLLEAGLPVTVTLEQDWS
jgi:hypothetical protein